MDKQRVVYICDQTRVHLDVVNNLGSFVELEVVLKENQTNEEGNQVAQQFITNLQLDSFGTVCKTAYVDMILNKHIE